MSRSGEFGAELRRRRLRAGISLSSFADRIFYSKGYLSRVENGDQRPSDDLARRCDGELRAEGALIRLACGAPAARALPEAAPAPPVACPSALDSDYRAAARAVDVLISFEDGFEHARRLGHRYSPRIILPTLLPQIAAVSGIAGETPDPEIASPLLRLVARQQEYAGWMFQEHGDDVAATFWTTAAGRTAATVGDGDFLLWTLVRKAEIALYRQDATAVVELCRHVAASCRRDPLLGAVAARVEAQGHALHGDRTGCFSALEKSAELGSRVGNTMPPFGTTSLTDPLAAVTGWVLYELGDIRRAAEVLDQELVKIPTTSVRSRARFGIRATLAHAAAGEIDHASSMTLALLDSAEQTASATIGGDLRRLGRCLSRWSTHPAVSQLLPRLRAACRPVDRTGECSPSPGCD